jgi:hypothetical protein
MAEEHEARQPYKCAVCGAKFDSQDQLQNHLKSCTQKKISFNPAIMPLMAGHGTFRAVIRSNTHLFKVECEQLINLIYQ